MLPKMLKNWLASLIWTFLISQYSIFMATRQLRFQSLHSNHQQSHGCSPLQGLVQGLSQSSTDINRFYRDVHHQNGWPRNNFSIQIFQFYNFNYLSSIYIYIPIPLKPHVSIASKSLHDAVVGQRICHQPYAFHFLLPSKVGTSVKIHSSQS